MPAALKEQFHSVYSIHTEGQTAPFLTWVWCPWCLFDFCVPDRDEWEALVEFSITISIIRSRMELRSRVSSKYILGKNISINSVLTAKFMHWSAVWGWSIIDSDKYWHSHQDNALSHMFVTLWRCRRSHTNESSSDSRVHRWHCMVTNRSILPPHIL